MAVIIQIPTALRNFTDRQDEVRVEGDTAGAALAALALQYPDIKNHLYQEDGGLRSFINVFAGDTNIKKLQGLDTPLSDGAVLMLVPAIAGGVREGTRTGERVPAVFGNTACPPVNVTVGDTAEGGAQEGTRTGERVPAVFGNTACPPVNVTVGDTAEGGAAKEAAQEGDRSWRSA
jgi:adenylyltransferase/sulfurtransferase